MPTVAHKNLTGTDLHEPKGADAAAADKVYVADGAGSGTWKKLTADQLETTGNPFGAQLFHAQDQKAAGTDGGGFTSGAWRTRTLNTEVTNEISGASLSSDQITLPAGTYFCMASAPGCTVNNHQIRLQNVTDATTTLVGTAEYTTSTTLSTTRSYASGRFTIAGAKVFELQHQCQSTRATDGFGNGANWTTVIYSDVKIWKIG